MGHGFSGDTAGYYARYRRGYPEPVIDALAGAFGLTGSDVVVDLGCGTGQLTLPLAERVRAAVGVDPEPDMLALARRAARKRGVRSASWMLGADTDLPALGALLGERSIAAVTAAVAIHWMDHAALFAAARTFLRDGGGVAVVTNGTPLWLQDNDWSRALRAVLSEWTGRDVGWACGTDADSRRGYRDAMAAAGYATAEARVDYDATMDVDEIVGGVFSAMSADQLPDPAGRQVFAERVRAALAPRTRVTEHVSVIVQTGTR
jgi:SAM-dependent methyltransferase